MTPVARLMMAEKRAANSTLGLLFKLTICTTQRALKVALVNVVEAVRTPTKWWPNKNVVHFYLCRPGRHGDALIAFCAVVCTT